MIVAHSLRGLGTLALAAMTASLCGCAGIGQALGVQKTSPDEFAIVTKAPLVIPPDYSLRPPAAATRGPAASDSEVIAQRALVGDRNFVTPTMSAGERALVTKAGAQYSDPMIRSVIDQEYADVLSKDEKLANRLIFWESSAAGGKSIDAVKESDRLEEAAAQGAPQPAQVPPTIKKDKPDLLDGLF